MMLDGTHIVALPGVPNELMLMFEQQVAPRISRLTGRHAVIVHRVINLFGKGESEIEAQALDLTARDHRPEVGITASDATISFRITCEGPDEAAAFAASEPTAKQIYERFGDLIVGEGDAGVADALVAALLKTSSTIAVAESCTGGLIAAQLTKFAGVSEVFLGGVVSYSNAAKSEFLGVPASLIEQKGAVSPEVAEAMAVGARTRFGSTLALSVTGIAGPGGGTDEKPVGLVYLGLATPRSIYHKRLLIGPEQPRTVIRSRAAKHAMNFARLEVGRL
jgi:nicotinamide-nucleotide amidase